MFKKQFLTCILTIIFIFLNVMVSQARDDHFTAAIDDWAPYEYIENGRLKGFSYEVTEGVMAALGRKIEKTDIWPWTRAEKLLREGSVDLIYSGSFSAEREEFSYFPEEPLKDSKWVFFIRKEDERKLKFSSYDDLKGKMVGVVSSYSYTVEMWDHLKSQKNYIASAVDGINFLNLMERRLDYVAAEYETGMAIVKASGMAGRVVALQKPIKVTGLYVMFSKKNVDKKFVDKFSDALKKFKKTDAYSVILKTYFK